MENLNQTSIRTGDDMFSFNKAFFAEYENLGILEKGLSAKDRLPMWQYANYLSRVAFCIELGMKTIITIEGDVRGHCLDKLYKMMPSVFREMVEKKTGWKNEILQKLELIRNIFVEFRYMNMSHLPFFLEEFVIDNGYVVFSKVEDIPNFGFVRILLEEIMDYYKFLYENIDKKLFSSKNLDTDEIEKKYIEELKRVQSLSYVGTRH
jgi:hypothetical protein